MAACRVAEKEGPLGGPRWAPIHQILGEERSTAWEVDPPKSLFDKPLLGGFIWDSFSARLFFFNVSAAFPVALVDLGELGVHYVTL